jgi:aminoglycoside phosphotransferase family enzyme
LLQVGRQHDCTTRQIFIIMALTANNTADIDISTKVAFLRQPVSYPGHPAEVNVIQTHMSWVFLTDRLVYKLKKPVRFEFLDFSTLERRQHDCLEEVRLNRRLARGVYLSVVPLTVDASGRLHLDGEGEPVDWLVKMQRLPRECMLDQVIAARRVEDAKVRTFSQILAGFYCHADPVSMTPHEYRQRFEQNINDYTIALSEPRYGLPHRQITMIKQALQQFLSDKPELFDARVKGHRIVEAHGDLRPEHICLIDPPVIIDCLEFNRALRILDPADELAFLALECEYAGAPYLGEVAFETYRQLTDDDPAHALVRFYKTLRALLRAKLSIRHLDDHDASEHHKWVQRASDYLQLAEHYAGTLDGQEY